MLKAVIFDLNGIFIQSPRLSDRFERDFHVPVSLFIPRLTEIMQKIRQPNAGRAFQYWKPALEEWGIPLSESEFWDYWFKIEVVSEGVVNFSKELRRKNIKIFILSNNFKERAEYYGEYPWIHEAVDKVYFSWQTGFVKPDPRAWEHIVSEHHLNPQECLYFDDQEKNITAAQGVGIPSFLFTNEVELQKIVNKYLSLENTSYEKQI